MKSLLWLSAAALLGASMPAAGQPAPFEINMQRVKMAAPDKCAKSTTYIVPTTYLYLEARATTTVTNRSASAKARVFVEGLDKAYLQSLARELQDDLVARLRAAGHTVLTFEDIRGDVASAGRMSPNAKYGLPTKTGPDRVIDFVVAAPTDEQLLDYGASGIGWPYRAAVKRTGATLLIPEIYFAMPQVGGTKGGNSWVDQAGLVINPGMKLHYALMSGTPPDLGWCNILVQEHGVRLAAEVAGQVQQLTEERSEYLTWSRTKGDFAFVLDQPAVRAGVLRAGQAFNALITATTQKK